uniref:Bach2 protein n=1 Tax=Mus musculus TaxID=10090 RepID=Q4KL56_MOUSE|nr:Bach2 protein [Mus musculus]
MSVDEKPGSPMYVYESTVHCANILLGLNDQRKKDILCDVTLIVERKEFRAHRAVLAACSEYFWQALVGQTKDDLVVSLPEEIYLHRLTPGSGCVWSISNSCCLEDVSVFTGIISQMAFQKRSHSHPSLCFIQ